MPSPLKQCRRPKTLAIHPSSPMSNNKRENSDELNHNPGQLKRYVRYDTRMLCYTFDPRFNEVDLFLYQLLRGADNPEEQAGQPCKLVIASSAKNGERSPRVIIKRKIDGLCFLNNSHTPCGQAEWYGRTPNYNWNIIKTEPQTLREFVASAVSCLSLSDQLQLLDKQKKYDIDQQSWRLGGTSCTTTSTLIKLRVQLCFFDQRRERERIRRQLDAKHELERNRDRHCRAIETLTAVQREELEARRGILDDMRNCSALKTKVDLRVVLSEVEVEMSKARLLSLVRSFQSFDDPGDKLDGPEDVKKRLEAALAETGETMEKLKSELSDDETNLLTLEAARSLSFAQYQPVFEDYENEEFLKNTYEIPGYKDERVKELLRQNYSLLCKHIKKKGDDDLRNLIEGHSMVSTTFFHSVITKRTDIRGPISNYVNFKDGTPDLVIFLITGFFHRNNLLSMILSTDCNDKRFLDRKLRTISPTAFKDVGTEWYKKGTTENRDPEEHDGSILSYLDISPHIVMDEHGGTQECNMIGDYLINVWEIDRRGVCTETLENDSPRVFEIPTEVCNKDYMTTSTKRNNQSADFTDARPLDFQSKYRLVPKEHDFACREKLQARWNQKMQILKEQKTSLEGALAEKTRALNEGRIQFNKKSKDVEDLASREKELSARLVQLPTLTETYENCKTALDGDLESLERMSSRLQNLRLGLRSRMEQLRSTESDILSLQIQLEIKEAELFEINTDPEFQKSQKRLVDLEDQLEQYKRKHGQKCDEWIEEAQESVLRSDVEKRLADLEKVAQISKRARSYLELLIINNYTLKDIHPVVLCKFLGVSEDVCDNFATAKARGILTVVINKSLSPCVFVDKMIEIDSSKQLFIVRQPDVANS